MTSTADTAQHPDIEEISDLTEGLLSPSRTADVRRHIDTCPQCDDIHSSLEEIRSLLGDLPADQQMPEDVAARIDAALASESLAQPEAPSGATAPVSRETYEQPAEPPVVDRPSGRPRGATGPGRRPARRRRRTVILGTAFGAAVVGMGVFLMQSVQPAQNSADRASSAAEDSQRDFSVDTLEGQVHQLLGEAEASKTAESDGTKPSVDTKSSPQNMSPDSATPRNPLRTPVVDVPPVYSRAPAVIPRLWRWSTAATRAQRHSSSSCPTRPTRAAYRPMWSTLRASGPLPRQRDSCCSPTPTRAPERRAGSCSGIAGMHAP